MKVLVLIVILGIVLSKESALLEKRRGGENNKKIVDFLTSRKQQMETFLGDVMNQSSINDYEMRLLKEIKEYVVLLG